MLRNFTNRLKISHRLLGGFTVLVLLLAAVVGTTVWKTAAIKKSMDLIVDVRMPTALAHAQIINSINGSLAALRGYMLTGDPKFKKERAMEWKNIAKLHKDLDRYSKFWSNQDYTKNMQGFDKILWKFKLAQVEVEKVANSEAEQPAKLIMVNEAAPLAEAILQFITAMIDDELDNAKKNRSAFAERSKYLGYMTGFRGSFSRGITGISEPVNKSAISQLRLDHPIIGNHRCQELPETQKTWFMPSGKFAARGLAKFSMDSFSKCRR